MAGSAMDRVFSTIANTANKVLGGNQSGQATDPSQTNNSIPGPGNNVQSDGSVKAIPAAATGTESPLANYTELFKDDPDKPAMRGVPDAMPTFAFDATKVAQAAKDIDFTAGITSAEIAEVYPGIPEATARKLLNSVSAKQFETNFGVTAQGIQTAMQRQTTALTDTTIPEIIRRQQASQLTGDVSYSKDPMTAPVFDMLKDRFTNKYPDATPAQIADHTQKYMEKMFETGVAASGKKIVNQPKQRQADTDWDDFVQDDFGSGAIFN